MSATPLSESPSSTDHRPSPLFAWMAAALFAVYVALRIAAPHVRALPPAFATLTATVVFLLLSLAIVVAAARLSASWPVEVAALALGVCLWFLGGAEKTGLLSDCALIFSAVPLGLLVSRAIRYPNLLVPIGAVAAIVDVWGVNLQGPVSQAMAKAPETAQRFVTHVPAFGPPQMGGPQFIAVIGVGDFVFLALFFACIHRFRMNFRGAAIWAAAFALLGLYIALRAVPMPGLPFIALGVLLPNARHFHFDRSEKFALLYGGVFLAVCLGLATLAMRRAASRLGPGSPPARTQQQQP